MLIGVETGCSSFKTRCHFGVVTLGKSSNSLNFPINSIQELYQVKLAHECTILLL